MNIIDYFGIHFMRAIFFNHPIVQQYLICKSKKEDSCATSEP